MSQQIKLNARPRTEVGKSAVKQVRQRGGVPAVIYGTHQEPQDLEVNARDIEQILARAIGENLLVDLSIEGDSATKLAMIQDVQHHPLRGEILHVDFHAVRANETITAEIPIEPTGEAAGVKTGGGIMEQMIRELEVECLPKDLPEVLTIDVSSLQIGDAIHVKDIPLPSGLVTHLDEDITVFLVAEPTVPTDTEEEAATEPELIGEKAEDSGEEGQPSKEE